MYFVGPQNEKLAAALAQLVERFARESLAIIRTELKPDTDCGEQEFGQVVARDQRVSDATITAMAKTMMASLEIAALAGGRPTGFLQ